MKGTDAAVNFEPLQDKVTQLNPLRLPQRAKFWTVDTVRGKLKAQPCWACIRAELIEMGFRTYWPAGLYKGTPEFIRVQGNVLHPIEAHGIKNVFVGTHIDTMDGTQEIETESGDIETFDAIELEESFLRVMGNNFAASQLHSLPPFEGEILRDTRTSAFFLFQNKIVEVTAGKERELSYTKLGRRCVWSSQIIKRDFIPPPELKDGEALKPCEFEKFLKNITKGIPARMNAFTSAIGYLLHNFTKQSEAKVVWLTDEAVTDKDTPQGRSGKGMFMKAIRELRNVHYRNGKAYKPSSDFFFQGITPDTQIVWLDDPNELFNFENLFSVAVEGWVVSRKHREDLTFSLEESPKTYIASNQPPNLRGSSNIDRLQVLTAGSFYTDRLNSGTGKPIVDVHGAEFFTGWDADEWARFYTFMIKCVSNYLKDGLRAYACPSLKANQLIRQTSREFEEWTAEPCLNDGGRLDDGTERDRAELLTCYQTASGDDKQTARTFKRWLRVYAELNSLKFAERKSNGKQFFVFTKKSDEVPSPNKE